jgi:hypothetical protein
MFAREGGMMYRRRTKAEKKAAMMKAIRAFKKLSEAQRRQIYNQVRQIADEYEEPLKPKIFDQTVRALKAIRLLIDKYGEDIALAALGSWYGDLKIYVLESLKDLLEYECYESHDEAVRNLLEAQERYGECMRAYRECKRQHLNIEAQNI